MKGKHLLLGVAVVLAAGGVWLGWSGWRTGAVNESSKGVGVETPQGHESDMGGFETQRGDESRVGGGSNRQNGQLQPRQMLRPPEPNRRFADFTPEQRVQFARQGHGPGG